MSSRRHTASNDSTELAGVAFQPATAAGGGKAHALPVSMRPLGENGLTRCGFPVEYLTVVPQLLRRDVDPQHRCRHCAAASA